MARRVCSRDIAQAGSLGELITQLIDNVRVGNMEQKERGAMFIRSLTEQPAGLDGIQDVENVVLLARANAIKPLVQCVVVGSPVAQAHSCAALANIANGRPEYQEEVVNAGGVLAISSVLRAGDAGLQEQAAAAIASVSQFPASQKSLVQAGGVLPLISLLKGASADTQVHASEALANLAKDNLEGQSAIYKGMGVPLLIALLGSGKAQEAAAHALAKLAQNNEIIQADITHRGGIPRLIALLSVVNTEAQAQAAAALAALASGDSRHEQDVIAKAGGIRPLLALVESRYPSAQRSAVNALAMLALNHPENQEAIASMGGIMPLVGLTHYGEGHSADVQAQAVLALTEISRHNKENQTAIADGGAISSLVALLRHSGAPIVEAEVAGAMWALSEDHEANKVSIASAGAIPALMTQLASQVQRAHNNAANALSSLAIGNASNQAEIAALLVGLLEDGNNDTQTRASQALWRMVAENPGNEVVIAKAGGAEPLVRLLTARQAASKSYALWSLSLSIDADNQKVVADTGGIKPLVNLLNARDRLVNEQAACAIQRLAMKNHETQVAIAKQGAIEPLIALLDGDGADRSQEYAAAALSELALVPVNKLAIDRGGGIQPIVALLSDTHRQHASKKYAAAALARLSAEERKKQTQRRGQDRETAEEKRLADKARTSKAETIAEAGAISPLVDLLSGEKGGEAQEEAAGALLALAENESNRMAITEAGGIGPLVLLLGCPNERAREHSEGALVRLSIETTNRVIIIKQLVGMLDQERGTAAQEQAAAALANLARESTENRTSILEAGGIPRLLALMNSNSAKAKENAVSAISQLAYNNKNNQAAISSANGIATLVNTLVSASLNVKELSGVKLCELTSLAIWNMACDNKENQSSLMKEGAIPPIVGMVTNPVPELQTNAAGALACLAKDHQDNQAAIARSGAIPPLCTNVRDGTPETREESAAALWALATDNAPNKATIAKLGGIEPLVSLLLYGASEKSSINAAGALAALATQHSDNRLTITKRMVGVLGSKLPATRATRLLSALASLCENESTNQVAFAKSGGIQHIVNLWLGNSSEDVQVQAARALLSVAGNNQTTQALIGKLGGIQPLVTLVQRSILEAQEHSACALWHLATISENRVLIYDSNGIPPLVQLLVAEGSLAPQLAAMTILRLAEGSSKAATKIAQSGGIKPIVNLLTVGTTATQQMAAAALAAAGHVSKNRDAIANADAVRHLVRLLTDKTLGTPETAARALSYLSREDNEEEEIMEEAAALGKKEVVAEESAEGEEGAEGDANGKEEEEEDAHTIVGAEMRRMCIQQAGGIKTLISMLDGTNLSPEGMKPATVGGWSAVRVGIAGCIELSQIFPGSQVDFGMRIGMQEQSAATLADLARHDTGMQDAIVEDQGVPPLLSLVRAGSQLGQEYAAATMWYLATSFENQKVIVGNNSSIADIVALLKAGTPRAQYYAAAGLAQLASGAVSARRTAWEAKMAAKRNKRSSRESRESGDLPGLATGGVPAPAPASAPSSPDPLANAQAADGSPIADFSNEVPPSEMAPGSPAPAATAAAADPSMPVLAEPDAVLGMLPEDEGEDGAEPSDTPETKRLNQPAKARRGSIAQLPPIIGGYDGMSVDVLTTINDNGGIPPLVKLCEFGTQEGKEKAAAALWHLAIDMENQAQIANNGGIKPLVSLLADGTEQAQRHASDALTRLATENSENQAQIAKRLVGLLDHDDASVVSRAAHDLQALAQDHDGAPVVIVNAGAISPLVTVLSNGKTDEGRQEAAKTLHTLANSGPANQIAIAIGLVALLGVGTDQAQEYVTELLLTLCGQGGEGNRKAIAKAGPFKMLVLQLRSDSARVKMLASAVISKLSGDAAQNVEEISKADGIPPLVALLETDDMEAQENVTIVLADMTRRDQEHAIKVASEGGIPLLAALLLSEHSVDAKAQAASTLGSISKGHPEQVGDAGAIEPLVKLLTTDNREAQLEGALALAGIAAGGQITQDRIKEAGGIELLVNLLKGAFPGGAEQEGAVPGSAPPSPSKADCADDAQATMIKLQSNVARALAELARDHPDNQVAITQCGGIQPLIDLVNFALTEQPKEEAAAALWALSSNHNENQEAIAAANGIDSLVALVSRTSDRGQEQAAGALASLSLDNEKNQTRISQLLVDNLGESSAVLDTREKAARAIARFAKAHATNQDSLSNAGAVALTVSLLEPKVWEMPVASKMPSKTAELVAEDAEDGEEQHEDTEATPTGEHHLTQRELSSALWSLAAENASIQTQISAEGGIPLLIAMLSDHAEIHREAAGALWSLSADAENRKLIAEAGGIPKLVELLKYGAKNVSAQETATGALHVLAQRAENRDIIADAGGIACLVPLFDGGTPETKELVAAALLTLALENASNQFNIANKLVAMLANGPTDAQEALTAAQMSRVEAQEHATRVIYTMSLDRDNRDALSRTGAIMQLVRQLKSGSEKAQNMASNALSQIARMSPDLRIQVTQQLVTLLGNSNADVRQRAGVALRDNNGGDGGEDKKNQREAAMAGGVAPLVELLKAGLNDDRVEAQEYSLWSLSMITDPTRRRHMAEEGCIPALIQSMAKGQLSADSLEHAAMVLACLCIDSANHEVVIERSGVAQMVALLSGDGKTLGAKKQGAVGLGLLADHDGETQARIAKAGAIPPLVEWFNGGESSGPPDVAARALSAIAHENEELQTRIAEAGAIPPLVVMLSDDDTELHITASEAIATLARNVPANQAKVAAAGGIPPLVALLTSSRLECQENASKSIAALSDDEDNKIQILRAGGIGPLVALLNSGNDETQQYCAMALETLARDIPEIQATLAHVGASLPLTTLLGSDLAATQESAMAALLCMASHPNSTVTVVKRLVGVLNGKNTAAQLKAAQALAVLAGRSSANRSTIVHAGAIVPLVGLLGNGQRADKNTPPERAAAVLADLARISESKVEIPRAGGIAPLVIMLDSSCKDAQTFAACALRYLSVAADNKNDIVLKGGIQRFVNLLSTGTLEGQRHAANALWQVATSSDNKAAIVSAGGISPLVALMRREEPMPPQQSEGEEAAQQYEQYEKDIRSIAESKESAAAVLSELARSQAANRKVMVREGGIPPLADLIRMGSDAAQKHATCALWGLAQDERYRGTIVETEGAIERLVELLRDFEGESQGFAAATLVCLAQDDAGKQSILTVGGPGPLMTIALGPANWLRAQCVEVLKLLGYDDPTEKMTEAPLSPRLVRYQAELCSNPAVWMMTEEPQKQPINDEHMADLARKVRVGDRVVVDPGSRLAEVRYVGKIPEIAAGFWVGVQYDQAVGKNDGSVKGRRCFECQAEYGGFLRPDHIHPDPNPPARKVRTKEEEDAQQQAAAAAAAEAAAASENADPRARQNRRKKDALERKLKKDSPTGAANVPKADTPAADWENDWGAEDDNGDSFIKATSDSFAKGSSGAPPEEKKSGKPLRSRSPPEGDAADETDPPGPAKRKSAAGKKEKPKEPSPRSVAGPSPRAGSPSPRAIVQESPLGGPSPRAAGSVTTTPRASPKGTPRDKQEPPIASSRGSKPNSKAASRKASKEIPKTA